MAPKRSGVYTVRYDPDLYPSSAESGKVQMLARIEDKLDKLIEAIKQSGISFEF